MNIQNAISNCLDVIIFDYNLAPKVTACIVEHREFSLKSFKNNHWFTEQGAYLSTSVARGIRRSYT